MSTLTSFRRSYTPEGSPPARRRRLEAPPSKELESAGLPVHPVSKQETGFSHEVEAGSSRETEAGSSRQQATSHTSNATVEIVSRFFNKLTNWIGRSYKVSARDTDISNVDPSRDDLVTWLKKLDDLIYVYGWDENYARHVAVNKLRGLAERST